MNRIDILEKINRCVLSDDKQGAVNILCDILADKEYKNKYEDIIYIIIDSFQLYGFIKYIDNIDINDQIDDESVCIRSDSYKGKYLEYLNNEQLSITTEFKENKKTFLSAPTSFGKTSLVIEYILQNNRELNNIIFIIPTKSLIEELYLKLLKLNKVNNLGYYITINILRNSNRCIRILTPEKFITYYEYNSLSNINVLVMDETYKIENDGENEGNVVENRALKFRKVLDIVIKENEKTILLSPYTYEKEESMIKFIKEYSINEVNRMTNYVKHNIIDLSTATNFKQHFRIEDIVLNKKDYNTIADKVKNILKQLQGKSNVVYVSYPGVAVEILNEIKNENIQFLENNSDPRYEKFIKHLNDNYKISGFDEWYVVEALKKGIGIYISQMPRYVKKEIIDLFDRKVIKCLIVTTAFIEGVNSCAENIIITSATTAKTVKLNDMTLLNISGRAGRFGKSSIGNIYVINTEVSEKIKNAKELGVSISYPNYAKSIENKIRDDYEIDMIDEEYLNDAEKMKKQIIQEHKKNINLQFTNIDKISISAPTLWKLRLYNYFLICEDINVVKDIIKKSLSENKEEIEDGLTKMFTIIKESLIPFENKNFGISAFSKNGYFTWGSLYIEQLGENIKKILAIRKNKIEAKRKRIGNSLFRDTWEFKKYYDKNFNIKYDRIYDETFKFISNIIEYKIPYYISLFITMFKFYIQNNDIKHNHIIADVEKMDIVEIINKFETMGIDEKYMDLYDFGLPRDMIDKIINNNIEVSTCNIIEVEWLDDYEKLILNDFRNSK